MEHCGGTDCAPYLVRETVMASGQWSIWGHPEPERGKGDTGKKKHGLEVEMGLSWFL